MGFSQAAENHFRTKTVANKLNPVGFTQVKSGAPEQWKKGYPGWLGVFFGDEKLPIYIGIIIYHYKDPY